MKSKIIFIVLILGVFPAVFACRSTAKKEGIHAEGKTEKPVKHNPGIDPVSVSSASVNPDKIPVADYYFGFNTQMIHGPDWNNGKFINAVKNLHPENLRYPGGTIANYWDWKKGWFFKTENLPKQFAKVTPNPITLENFKLGIDATGGMPVFVLNMVTSDIKYQLEMLHHAKDIGLQVKFIELGNEFYGKEEKGGSAKFPTGKVYALEANKWISSIKKDFPDARIAVVGSGKSERKANNNSTDQNDSQDGKGDWDKEMFKSLTGADAVIFHIYQAPGVQAGSKNRINTNERNATAQRELKNAFDDNVEACLGIPFMRMKLIKEYNNSTVPKGMKIWYTEYNLFEKNLVVSGTWAHGLFVSLMSVLFLNIDQTELICNHNIAKNARFAAIFNDEKGFESHIEGTKTTPFSYSAGGTSLSLVGQAIKGKTTAQQLDFTNTRMLKTAKQVTYPSLLGYKFIGNGKESAIIFNLDASPVSLDFSKVTGNGLQFKTYSGDPLKQITDAKEIAISTGNLNGKLNLPAYSITVVY